MNERAYERAFPLGFSYVERRTNATVTYTNEGITVRDYFAAKALALLTNEAAAILEQNHHNPVLTAQDMARRAYLYADAMIEERAKEKP